MLSTTRQTTKLPQEAAPLPGQAAEDAECLGDSGCAHLCGRLSLRSRRKKQRSLPARRSPYCVFSGYVGIFWNRETSFIRQEQAASAMATRIPSSIDEVSSHREWLRSMIPTVGRRVRPMRPPGSGLLYQSAGPGGKANLLVSRKREKARLLRGRNRQGRRNLQSRWTSPLAPTTDSTIQGRQKVIVATG